MALLTIPSISKGTTASVSLNKSELFALTPVAADSYFSVQANVKRCIIEYNSNPGDQRKLLSFDLSQASPTAPMLISATGRDSFQIERLVLEDNDGGLFMVSRAQLPSGLDISLGGGQQANSVGTIGLWKDGSSLGSGGQQGFAVSTTSGGSYAVSISGAVNLQAAYIFIDDPGAPDGRNFLVSGVADPSPYSFQLPWSAGTTNTLSILCLMTDQSQIIVPISVAFTGGGGGALTFTPLVSQVSAGGGETLIGTMSGGTAPYLDWGASGGTLRIDGNQVYFTAFVAGNLSFQINDSAGATVGTLQIMSV